MNANLYICNNAFQIMTAVILADQIGNIENADIIITDRAANLEDYYKSITNLKIFRNTFFIHTKSCNDKNRRFGYLMRQARCEYFGCTIGEAEKLPFDYSDVYSIDATCLTNFVCCELQQKEITPHVHLFEEGFGCYTNMYFEHLYNKNVFRSIVKSTSSVIKGTKLTNNLIEDFYCYEPDLISWQCCVQIKQIKKPDVSKHSKLRELFNIIYSYEDDMELYKEQFIFFEDCVFQDSGDNRDYDVICQIAELVGKEEFLVKLHPRTQINRFTGNSIKTIKKQGMPWEIVVMNMDESQKHIFVTVSSSSVVAYSLLFKRNFTTILLFKCLPEFSANIHSGILNFLETYAAKKPGLIYIPETLEEAYQLIEGLKQSWREDILEYEYTDDRTHRN